MPACSIDGRALGTIPFTIPDIGVVKWWDPGHDGIHGSGPLAMRAEAATLLLEIRKSRQGQHLSWSAFYQIYLRKALLRPPQI